MRLGVINGNGCTCDSCHAVLLPDEAIKLKSYVLDKNDRSGVYNSWQKCDLCIHCYNKLLKGVMYDVRSNKLNGKSFDQIK